MNNTVYCYYEDLGHNQTHLPILEMWKKTWSMNGWNPVTINETTAMMYPRYTEFIEAVSKFPTVNNIGFELSCYRRHLAMVVVGGGMLCDHDTMNIRYRPEELPESNGYIQSLDQSGSPTPSYGSVEAWQKLVDYMQSYVPDRTHVSDMIILQKFIQKRHTEIAMTLVEDGWEKAPIIHFHNEGVRHVSGGLANRVEFIRSTISRLIPNFSV